VAKKAINKEHRKILLTALIILVLAPAFLLIKDLGYPQNEVRKVPLYSYKSIAEPIYTVALKPNILYEQNSLPQDSVYLAEFVDRIQSSFRYSFKGERTAAIQGEYEVIAVMEGYVSASEKNKTKTIWQKQYVLVPKTAFAREDSALAIVQEIPIQFGEYNKYATAVMDQAKIKTDIRMSVIMNVALKAKVDQGVIEDKAVQALTFPLAESYFEISKDRVEEQTKALEETRTIPLPLNRTKVTLLGLCLTVLLAALAYVCFGTVGLKSDPLQNSIKNIFKKYGSRLVVLRDETSLSRSNVMQVKSFEDLVRIADDLAKPILYRDRPEVMAISEFYILDDNCIYSYDVQALREGGQTKAALPSGPRQTQPVEKPLEA